MRVEVTLPRTGESASAKGAAEAVVHDIRPFAPKTVRIPAISVQRGAAVVLVERAVKLIAATLGDQDDLCPASQVQTAARIVGFYLELLNALHRRRNRSLRPSAESLVIVGVARGRVGDLAAVQQEGILIAARPGYLAAETAGLQSGCGLLRHGQRLQKQQAGCVPLQCRQSENLIAADNIADCRVQRLQLGPGQSFHFHDLGNLPDAEVDIDRGCLAHFHPNRGRNGAFEAGSGHANGIGAGRHLGKNVLALCVGGGREQGPGGEIAQFHLRLRDRRTRRVADPADDLAGRQRLAVGQMRWDKQTEREKNKRERGTLGKLIVELRHKYLPAWVARCLAAFCAELWDQGEHPRTWRILARNIVRSPAAVKKKTETGHPGSGIVTTLKKSCPQLRWPIEGQLM